MSNKRKQVDTLEPNGKEPGYIGFRYDITNEQSVPGLQVAPKATTYYPEFGTWKTAYIPLWW